MSSREDFSAQPSLAVLSTKGQEKKAQQLSSVLNCVLLEERHSQADFDFILFYKPELHIEAVSDGLQLCIDFEQGSMQYRSQRMGKDTELLLKAVAARPGLQVLDATAGLGRDAFLMASAGCDVVVCERNPVVYQLLNDALQRVAGQLAGKLELLPMDAVEYLRTNLNQFEEHTPQVIYLDPMFPHRKKSAAVKKEMQILQKLVGIDEDIAQLLELSLQGASHRVVLKRPAKAELPVLESQNSGSIQQPTMQVAGKSTRFDVWVKKKL